MINTNERINYVLSKIKPLAPEKIILFGSCAREDASFLSDIDIIVIWNTNMRFIDRIKKFYEIINPDFPLDLLIYTSQEIEKMKSWSSFIKEALREGKIIYEKKQ